MKAGKTANDYRQTPWKHSPGPGRLVHPPNPESPASPRPYPRHVKDADDNTHVVKSAAEERSITGIGDPEEDPEG